MNETEGLTDSLITPRVPVGLRSDGVLWMINRVIFHPRGYALGFDPAHGFSLLGDGGEVWRFDPDSVNEDELLLAFNALLAKARFNNHPRKGESDDSQ